MAIMCLVLALLFIAFGGVIIFTESDGEERQDEAIAALFGSGAVCFIIALAYCGC